MGISILFQEYPRFPMLMCKRMMTVLTVASSEQPCNWTSLNGAIDSFSDVPRAVRCFVYHPWEIGLELRRVPMDDAHGSSATRNLTETPGSLLWNRA